MYQDGKDDSFYKTKERIFSPTNDDQTLIPDNPSNLDSKLIHQSQYAESSTVRNYMGSRQKSSDVGPILELGMNKENELASRPSSSVEISTTDVNHILT